jgi:hypothetical protein
MNPSITSSINSVLIPVGQTLLFGAFGWTLVQSLRTEDSLQEAFESLALGLLALLFYRQAADVLLILSQSLMSLLERHGGGVSVMSRLHDMMRANHQDPKMLEDFMAHNPILMFKNGIWGVLISISQFVFVCAEAVLELAQKVLWQLILILFPVAAGLFPIFPVMMKRMALYAVELSLWLPVLYLVNMASGAVLSTREVAGTTFGMGVIITELLTIILILHIPVVTHRFMSGAFDHLMGSGGPAIQYSKRAWGWGTGRIGSFFRVAGTHNRLGALESAFKEGRKS